ncbi:MFS transporter [Thermodesulfobacteriota bacterium B35]
MSRNSLPQYQRILLLVATGVFMSTMDSSMVNVALPTIMETFSATLAVTEWTVLIYLLTITVMLLFWGDLSRSLGQGAIYGRGLLLFATGSLLCSLAPTIHLLIFFRFVQALGASMMMAMGPALIRSAFPPEKLGLGLGQIGIATSLGLMTGPAVSGILIRWSHWRAIFWITVPVGILVYLLGRKLLAMIDSDGGNRVGPDQRQRFDRTGALLWTLAIILTILVTTGITSSCCTVDRRSPFFLAGAALTVLLPWIILIRYESRIPDPILPLHLFRKRFFSMAMLSGMLSFTVLFFVLILMPFFLTRVTRLTPDRVGYVMMAVPLCVFFVAPLAGRLHDRIGARIVATTGLACCLVAMLLLSRLQADSGPLAIALRLAFLGFGQAMFLAPNSAAALGGVEHAQSGITSSLLATARNMGMLLGTALSGLIFALAFSRLTGGLDVRDYTARDLAAFLTALHLTFGAGAILAAIGLVASWLREEKQGV